MKDCVVCIAQNRRCTWIEVSTFFKEWFHIILTMAAFAVKMLWRKKTQKTDHLRYFQAASLPMSIIIIGVGDADFEGKHTLNWINNVWVKNMIHVNCYAHIV